MTEPDHDGPSGPIARAPRSDQGFSIIEIVISLALIGIVVMAILDAVITMEGASVRSQSAAQIETAIVNASDRVNRAPKGCNYLGYAQAAVQMQGWDHNLVTAVQEYYQPGANAATAGTWQSGTGNSPACPGLQPADLLVQRVTITITTPDGKARRTIQVVKSDV